MKKEQPRKAMEIIGEWCNQIKLKFGFEDE